MVLQKIRIGLTLLLSLVIHAILPMNELTPSKAVKQNQVTQVQSINAEAEPLIDRPVVEPRIAYALPHKRPTQPQTASLPVSQAQAAEDQVIKPHHPARLGLRIQPQPTQANCHLKHQPCTSDEPKNLELAKRKIKKYYEHDYIRNVACLTDQIKHYVEHVSLPENAAAVFDIDDTTISSFDYAISTNFGYTTASYHEWELHPKRPIPPMLDLYNFMINKGIKVFFVTGRNEARRQVTEDNLRTAGYVDWKKLYLRPQNDDADSVAPYKTNARRDIESQGFRIIVNIGDQESDLIGGFADKTFKMPNPMYTLY